jgi:hypothetical protein
MSGVSFMNEKVGLTIYLVSLAVMVLVVFLYLVVVRGAGASDAKTEPITRVQALIQLDLINNYPATPRELASLCTEFAQCLYNETYTDEEFEKLAFQLYKLHSESFYKEFPWATYMTVLKESIDSPKSSGRTIAAYVIFGGTDVYYYLRGETECATVNGTVSFREGQNVYSTDTAFDIRKDGDGNWRLWYWQMTDSGTNRFPLVMYQ